MSGTCLHFGPDTEAFVAMASPPVLVITSVSMMSKSTYSLASIFLLVLLDSIQDAGCLLDPAAVHAWPRDVQVLEGRDFDLVRERRLGGVDCRVYGDWDLDDVRELRLLSSFWFPRLRLCVRIRPSLVA